MVAGPLTFRLAREFGFCYGVDRAVDYAYETRHKFPDRRLAAGGRDHPQSAREPRSSSRWASRSCITARTASSTSPGSPPDDVVIMPAFGVTIRDFERLRGIGCVMVDTTCGSVLNVWKRVEGYARDGFTAVIHGKHYHEETKATASQVMKYPGGRYLVVFNMEEARVVCDYIERRRRRGGAAAPLRAAPLAGVRLRHATSSGWASRTRRPCSSGESLAIAEEFRRSMERRYGDGASREHFRTFDTICSATQERQDAVVALLEEPLDVMVVVGGYNSSNTCNLAALCRVQGRAGVSTSRMPTAWMSAAGTIRHQPVGSKVEATAAGWLSGARRIGITAGASTPNNKVGETIARICESAGVMAELRAVLTPGS